jgi:hypothetical protein
MDSRWLAAIVAVLVVVGGYAATRPTTSPAPAPATTTSTTVPASDCGRLKVAQTGETVRLDGTIVCDFTATQPAVTVTGTATGDIVCRACDRWSFTDVDLTGTLRMIGGNGWQIIDSHFDGADRGLYSVLNVGATPEAGQPTNWLIRDTVVERPGNSPEHADNQDHAVYIIGRNDVGMGGVVEGGRIIGGGAGAALKIGGTGNFAGSPDAADAVTVRRVEVSNPGDECVLLATDSDNVVVDSNIFDCATAVVMDGPWTGTGTILTGNAADAGRWLQVGFYRWGWFGDKVFEVFPTPEAGCGRWAFCADNVSL